MDRRDLILRRSRTFALFCTGMVLCGSSGCMDFLPAGDPPSGDIVKNDPDPSARETPRARENRLATALIACALSNCPGAAWSLQCPPESRGSGARLMQAAAETAGVRRVPEGTPGCHVLRGEGAPGAETWSLLSPSGEPIFQVR